MLAATVSRLSAEEKKPTWEDDLRTVSHLKWDVALPTPESGLSQSAEVKNLSLRNRTYLFPKPEFKGKSVTVSVDWMWFENSRILSAAAGDDQKPEAERRNLRRRYADRAYFYARTTTEYRQEEPWTVKSAHMFRIDPGHGEIMAGPVLPKEDARWEKAYIEAGVDRFELLKEERIADPKGVTPAPAIAPRVWYNVKYTFTDTHLTVTFDGNTVIDYDYDGSALTGRRIGFGNRRTQSDVDMYSQFKDFKVWVK